MWEIPAFYRWCCRCVNLENSPRCGEISALKFSTVTSKFVFRCSLSSPPFFSLALCFRLSHSHFNSDDLLAVVLIFFLLILNQSLSSLRCFHQFLHTIPESISFRALTRASDSARLTKALRESMRGNAPAVTVCHRVYCCLSFPRQLKPFGFTLFLKRTYSPNCGARQLESCLIYVH